MRSCLAEAVPLEYQMKLEVGLPYRKQPMTDLKRSAGYFNVDGATGERDAAFATSMSRSQCQYWVLG